MAESNALRSSLEQLTGAKPGNPVSRVEGVVGQERGGWVASAAASASGAGTPR